MYYLRTKAAANAIQFTVTPNVKKETTPVVDKEQVKVEEKPKQVNAMSAPLTDEELAAAALQCSIDNPDDCEMCGS